MLKIIVSKMWKDSLALRWALLVTSLIVAVPWLVIVIFKENSVWFVYLLYFLMAFVLVARIVIYIGELSDEVKRHLTKRAGDNGNESEN